MECRFRKCAKQKDVAFCFLCGDYPCSDLQAFMNDKWPHHGPMKSSLEAIRNDGVENWLQAQQSEWSCRRCGADTFWYQKRCWCGQELEAWEDPEP
jgi:hypothetical protein